MLIKFYSTIIFLLLFKLPIFNQVQFIKKLIDNSSTRDGLNRVAVGDFNNDQLCDILVATSGSNIVWYTNDNGFSNSNMKVISSSINDPESVYLADLDNDNDLDILLACGRDNKISWYKNIDGKGDFSNEIIISTQLNGASGVHAADLDGDSFLDVISASTFDDKIAWYTNINGASSFSSQKVISILEEQIIGVYAADLDKDNDKDIISVARHYNNLVWYENTDGNGSFALKQIISKNHEYSESFDFADIDGDGDIDIVASSWYDDRIAWYENTNGKGLFGAQKLIGIVAESEQSATGVQCVKAADIDCDNDFDIVAASPKELVWYENTDGKGTFGSKQIIDTINGNGTHSICVVDLDKDNDMDIVSVIDKKIAWYENQMNPTTIRNSQGHYPDYYYLFQNYPNPFNPVTNISYYLPKRSFVDLSVYDHLGKKVLNLVNASKNKGSYSVQFDGSKFSSGVYYYCLDYGDSRISQKMLLIK